MIAIFKFLKGCHMKRNEASSVWVSRRITTIKAKMHTKSVLFPISWNIEL